MICRTWVLAGAVLVMAASAQAQTPTVTFDQAVYVTCRHAQNMQPEPRKALAIFLAEHAARHRGCHSR